MIITTLVFLFTIVYAVILARLQINLLIGDYSLIAMIGMSALILPHFYFVKRLWSVAVKGEFTPWFLGT